MNLLELELFEQPLSLEMLEGGIQNVYFANQLVSQLDISRVYSDEIVHRFSLQADNSKVDVSLNLQADKTTAQFQLWLNNKQHQSGEFALQSSQIVEKPKQGMLGIFALALKLFKSIKVIKIALAATAVAGYAWLFSLEFALVLVTCLVAHEYGHVKAMQYFGIKTKGIYIIPFVGGLAVSDDKINTRWQDVVISIMGPCFGLFMSIACLILYSVTGNELFAGAAVIGSLLNLFNLLPILPLDGGHVLKSICFSMNSWLGLAIATGGIVLGIAVAYTFNLLLLGFFLFIGALEVIFQWKTRLSSSLIPLDRYGQIFSAVWYLLIAVGHSAVIVMFADSDNAILSLPMKILAEF